MEFFPADRLSQGSGVHNVVMQEWDADMDVKNEVEDDNLAEDFDKALNESMAAKDEDGDDREVRHPELIAHADLACSYRYCATAHMLHRHSSSTSYQQV